MTERRRSNPPIFLRQVTWGNILSIVSAIVTMAIAWHELDKSVAVLRAELALTRSQISRLEKRVFDYPEIQRSNGPEEKAAFARRN